MANINKAVISDFTGGMNDINPPDQLKDDESVELINLFPGQNGYAIQTRPGTARFNRSPSLLGRVTGMNRYVRRDGSKRWLAATGNQLASTGVSTGVLELPPTDPSIVYTGNWWMDKNGNKTTNSFGAKAVITFAITMPGQFVEVREANIGAPSACTMTYSLDGLAPITTAAAQRFDPIFPRWIIGFSTLGTHTITLTFTFAGTPPDSTYSFHLNSVALVPPDDPYIAIKTGLAVGAQYTFCTWMDALYIANGSEPIQRWKPDTVTKVLPPSTTNLLNSPAENMPYIMSFRSRIWAAGKGSKVAFCGTLDESGVTFPDENWSGMAISDGGSLSVAADNGESVTGLGYMFNGVVVFKERSTYLWAWDDSSSPTQGSYKIELLIPGVGCASHYTIAYYNGSLIFLGQSSEGAYAVYRLQGTGIDDIAVKIPNRLHRILANAVRKPTAIIHDHKYYIAADDGNTNSPERTLVFCYDLRRGGWTEIEGWSVGSWAVDRENGHMFIGSDTPNGVIYDYPVGSSDDGAPIHYRLVSKPLFGKDPFARHRWRAVWADIIGAARGAMGIGLSFDGGTEQMSLNPLEAAGYDFWNDGVGFWGDGTLWPSGSALTHISMETTGDSRTATVVIDGKTVAPIAIERIGVGFRNRKANY